MSRRFLVLMALACALLLAVSAVAIASTPKMSVFSYTGTNADANWSEGEPWMEEGSAWSSVGVWGGTGKQVVNNADMKNGAQRTQGGFVSAENYTPASAEGPETYWALILDVPGSFTCDRALTMATLHASAVPGEVLTWTDVMPWDEEGALPEVRPVTVSVDVTWEGYGPLWFESFASKTRTDGFMSTDRSRSDRRDAEAEGTIVATDGTVFFDSEFQYAGIYNTKGTGHFRGSPPEPTP